MLGLFPVLFCKVHPCVILCYFPSLSAFPSLAPVPCVFTEHSLVFLFHVINPSSTHFTQFVFGVVLIFVMFLFP